MNEQIKQLAEQAWDYADYYGMLSDSKEHEIFTEKFAELIVRECMDVCYRTDTEYEGHKVKPTVIASKVAEHFGVEE